MQRDTPTHDYEVGDYVDYSWVTWVIKVIAEITPDGLVKLRDPRTYVNTSIEFVNTPSPKIRPFRCETRNRGYFHNNSSYMVRGNKKLNIDTVEQRVQELRNFDLSLRTVTAKQVVQFLRGRHYFFIDELVFSQLENEAQYQAVLSYTREHLDFYVRYLQELNFDSYVQNEHYASPMAALCSSFIELKDITLFALGLNNDFDNFRKDNLRWYRKDTFEQGVHEWFENSLLPVLPHLKYETFPPNILLCFFDMLLSLLKKTQVGVSEPLSQLFVQLYGHFVSKIGSVLPEAFTVEAFLRESEAIFKVMHRSQLQLPFQPSSHTQRLDSDSEQSKGEEVLELLSCEHYVKAKRLQFRAALLRVYLSRQKYDFFVRDINQCLQEVGREMESHPPNLMTFEQHWPSTVRGFLLFVRESGVIERLLCPQIVAGEHFANARQALSKIYRYMSKEVLAAVVKSRKLMVIKYLVTTRPLTAELAGWLVDLVVATIFEKKEGKEAFELLAELLMRVRPSFTEEALKPVRQKIVGKIFEVARDLNLPEYLPQIEHFLDQSDPLKDALMVKFAEEQAFPHLESALSVFEEIIVFRYAQKHRVSLPHFKSLCQFMSDPAFEELRYEKRKATVISVLHTQYRFDKQGYFQYLSCFLDYFCLPQHDRVKHCWTNFSVYPLTVDGKAEFMSCLPSREYCADNLSKLSSIHYELDINLYYLLLVRYNFLGGALLLSSEGEVQSVLQVPAYLKELFAALLSGLKKTRQSLVQRYVIQLFTQAEPSCYSDMLKVVFDVIIDTQVQAPQVVDLFVRLRRKTCKLVKLQTSSEELPSPRVMIKVLNESVEKKLRVIEAESKGSNPFTDILVYDQRMKNNIILHDSTATDTFEMVRLRIAAKFGRQPQEFVLFADDQQLLDDQLLLPAYKTLLQMEGQGRKHAYVSLTVMYASLRTSFYSHLLQRMPATFALLPYTAPILFGTNLLMEEWLDCPGLVALSEILLGYLRDGILPANLQQDLPLHFVLDFYIYQLADSRTSDYQFLLSSMREIAGQAETYRNYKILYLIYQSRKLDSNRCEELLRSLLPREGERDKDLEAFMRGDDSYDCYADLVLRMVEMVQEDCLQFLFTLRLMKALMENGCLGQKLQMFWKRVYESTSLERKVAFFSNMEQRMLTHPDNMYYFPFVMAETVLPAEHHFYTEMLLRMVKQTVALHKPALSIGEDCAIRVLVANINVLLVLGMVHEVLFSQQFHQFMVHKLYEFRGNALDELLGVLRQVASRPANREQLLSFFQRQVAEKEWEGRPILQRAKRRGDMYQVRGLVGLRNPHSICYANSFLQQLYHIDLFRRQLLGTDWRINPVNEEDLIYQLKRIFVNLRESRQPYINQDFFKAFKNMEGENTALDVQMDVDEFRNVLFDRVQALLPAGDNFVKRLFNGKQTSVITSLECEHQSRKEEDFSSVCIEVKGFQQLGDSLDNYLKPEVLQNENAYHCDDCGRKVRAEKRIQLNSFPPYLTFVLKRFQYVHFRRLKINSYFEFPLRGFHYFAGTQYSLKGVIIHQGVSEAGHYISLVRHNGAWYEFNDSFVNEVREEYVMECAFGRKQEHSEPVCSRNAYLLIYQADQLPSSTLCDPQQPFFGIEKEIKQIKRNKALQDKESLYFEPPFLRTVLHLVEQQPDDASLHLLYTLVTTIYFKLPKIDNQKDGDFFRALQLLREYRSRLSFVWQQKELEKIQALAASIDPGYKTVLCDILVNNCHIFDVAAETLLQDCLIKLYRGKDLTFQYCLLHEMARKFQAVCPFLNERRVVGRIIDLTLASIVGQRIRQDLKKTTTVPFQSEPARFSKDIVNSSCRYHKWALLNLTLQRVDWKITEVEMKEFVFHSHPHGLKAILEEASTKATLNQISRFFALLCTRQPQYFQMFGSALMDWLSKDKPQELRKYLRVLKEILAIRDQHKMERCKTAANIFQRVLKKHDTDRIEVACDYVWQWMLKIANRNMVFRNCLREFRSLFEFVLHFRIFGHKSSPYAECFKLDKSKNKYHGLAFASCFADYEPLHNRKIQRTRAVLSTEQYLEEDAGWDSDGDVTGQQLERGSTRYMKFDDNQPMGYRRVMVYWCMGDAVLYSYLDTIKNAKMAVVMTEKSNDRFALLHEPRLLREECATPEPESMSEI